MAAAQLGFSDYATAGCSAAWINDLTTFQPMIDGSQTPPQLDTLTGTETLVTLSIGINDSGYGDYIIPDCLSNTTSATPCKNKYVVNGENKLVTRANELANVPLGEAIDEIHQRSPGAEVWVIGYARLVPEDVSTCPGRIDISAGDAPVVNAWQAAVNDNEKAAAAAHGAYYVDVFSASTGHDGCQPNAADRWQNPGQNWMAGLDGWSLHPTLAGQTAVAQLFVAAYNTPRPDITPPIAPTVTRTAPTASLTNSNSQTITYSGEDGGTFECKLDGAAFATCPSSPVNLTSLANGAHTYSVKQTDAAGNHGSASSVTWTVDTLAPAAPTVIRTAPTANPTNSTSQTITYSGEAGGSFQCKLDSAAFAPCTGSPVSLPGLSNGSHTYSVTQTDAAGNLGSAATVTWTVDNVAPAAPTVTRTAPTADPTNSTSQTITYSGESGGTFKCKLDGAAFAPCPVSPVTLTAFSSGTHTYSITQTDAAGNLGSATAVSWVVDTIPPPTPTVTRTSPTANPTISNTQTLTYSGEAGGTLECKLDGAAFATCTGSPVTLSSLADGAHTYSVRQIDAAGNISATGSAAWTIGTGPAQPTVTRTSPTANPTTSTTQTLTYSGTGGNTFKCNLDGAAYANCPNSPNSPLTLSGLSDGSHTYSVTQTDGGGIVSPIGSVTWTVDTHAPAAPTVTRTVPSASPSNSSSQSLSYLGAEPGGSFKCKLDSAAYANCPGSPLTLNGLSDGPHTYSVTQTDDAGNVGSASTVTWTIDSVAPPAPTVARVAPMADPTASTAQKISYSGEAGGSFQCKLDGGAYAACAGNPVSLAGLGLGSHTFSVQQLDAANNPSPASAVSWTIAQFVPNEPPDSVDPISPSPESKTPAFVQTLSLKLGSKKVRPAASSAGPITGSAPGKNGAELKVTLAGSGSVEFFTDRARPGHVKGGKCRALSNAASKGRKACTRFVTLSSTVKLALPAGASSVYFTGRDGGKQLAAGKYRVRAVLGSLSAKTSTFTLSK
jgi:nitrite reductase/ring-hydroxylating ferredoxin subunit